MKQFLSVVAFSLLVIGFFAGFSNFGIPQIQPAPPPQEEKVDLSALTMDQFVALGAKIISGKGTCRLCHNDLGRAPMLEKLAANIPLRLEDPRYKGEAMDFKSYVLESMTQPSLYVVAGFGKKGTDDMESPMPDVTSGAIGLNPVELAAVAAALQDMSGVEITVEIPTDMGDVGDVAAEAPSGEPRAALTTPEEIIGQFACGACHKVGAEEGDVGPDLTAIGATRDAAYLRRAILMPNADIAEGFEPDMMPPDMGTQMYAAELETLVQYLASLK